MVDAGEAVVTSEPDSQEEDKYTKLVKERAMQSGLGMNAFVPDWARQTGGAAAPAPAAATSSVDLESSGAMGESLDTGTGGAQSSSGSDIDDPDGF